MVFLEQLGAGDVARHQVGRELHPRELEVERLGERLDEQRLGEAGHADEDDVAATEDGADEVVDDVVLADDAAPDLPRQRLVRQGQLVEEFEVALVSTILD